LKSGNARLTLTGASDFTGDFVLLNSANTTEIAASGGVVGTSNVRIDDATMLVNGGTLSTQGTVSFTHPTGVLRIDNGGFVRANQLNRAAVAGTLTWDSGTLNLTSNTKIGAAFAADTPFTGTLTMDAARTLMIDGTLDVNAGGTLAINGGSVTANTLNTSGAGLIDFNSGSLRLRDNQTLSAARIAQLDLATPIEANRSFTVDGSLALTSTMVLNGGTITADSVAGLNKLIMTGGTLNIVSGDVVTGGSQPEINATHATINVGGALDNQGSLNLIGANAAFAAASTNSATGTISAINSSLTFDNGLSNQGAMNLIHSNLVGNVTNAPGGMITMMGNNTVQGDLSMGAADLLQIRIGGAAPQQFDTLTVEGQVALAGSMNVLLTGGYDPQAGSSFELVSAGSVSGTFSSLALPLLDGGRTWNVAYGSGGVLLRVLSGTLAGDFNGDGAYDCLDIDALVQDIASGLNTGGFDLTSDGLVNDADLSQWLALAGGENLASGNPYLRGDANLDGLVDGSDFGVWNSHKFTMTAAWCSGDFDANGLVDGSDFGIWNAHKFTSADSVSSVPEPACIWTALWAMLGLCRAGRGRIARVV
ncbi:MAG TPA: hypothetical protein VIY86_12205, partial [Pirellulaceae bacterium]